MRLIDADKLRDEWLYETEEYCANEILNSIDAQPTVNIQIKNNNYELNSYLIDKNELINYLEFVFPSRCIDCCDVDCLSCIIESIKDDIIPEYIGVKYER
jgi:hypothetical protein